MAQVNAFQFHSGSIKTTNDLNTNDLEATSFNSTLVRLRRGWRTKRASRSRPSFQFHSGSIKTARRRGDVLEYLVFQFHSGSIKTDRRVVATASALKMFQFH